MTPGRLEEIRAMSEEAVAYRDFVFAKRAHQAVRDLLTDRDDQARQLAQSAERVAALTEALEELLDDTQHALHNCPDEDCPVTKAFLVLSRERRAAPDSTGAREPTEPPKDRWGRTAEMVELQNLMDEGDDD